MGTRITRQKHSRKSYAQRPRFRKSGARRLPWRLARRTGTAKEICGGVGAQRKRSPMATIATTSDQDTVVEEIFIAAAPARVFDAITDPNQMPQWWGRQGIY